MKKVTKKKVTVKKKSVMKKKVFTKKVEVKSSPVVETMAPIEDDETRSDQMEQHECTEECFIQPLPALKLTGNQHRMASMNKQVEYVMSFKPEIQRRADGTARVLIGINAQEGMVIEGPSVHFAMVEMFNLLTK